MKCDRFNRSGYPHALLVGALLLGSGIASAQTTDRVPNKEPEKAFPRWTPFTSLFLGPRDGNDVPLTGRAQEIAVDKQGIVHVAGDTFPGEPSTLVLYSNNRWETRGRQGFAPPFVVRAHPGTAGFLELRSVKITSGPDGKLAVGWLENRHFPNGASVFDVYLSKFNPTDGWEGGTNGAMLQAVLQGSIVTLPSGNEETTTYESLDLAYDPTGALHLALGRRIYEQNNFGQVVAERFAILLATNTFGSPTALKEGSSMGLSAAAVS